MGAEVTLEFMTGNPQLGVLSGRLTYLQNGQTPTSSSGSNRTTPGEKIGESLPEPKSDVSTVTPDSSSFSLEHASDVVHYQLSERRSKLLCLLSVPAHMVPTDMLQFAAPFKDQVHSIRILRPCTPVGPSDPDRTPAEYMVLLQMETQPSADDFFLQYNGKRFNSFEESVCRVVFVAKTSFDVASSSSPNPVVAGRGAGAGSITSPTFDASATAASSSGGSNSSTSAAAAAASGSPPPPSSLRAALRFSSIGGGGHGEADATGATAATSAGMGGGLLSPDKAGAAAAAAAATAADAAWGGWESDTSTCVICMDQMERRVLTTVCNHSFHVDCLMKWQDSPCPVCRFHHNNASEASTCQECRATDNLWVCLICGSVLCGSRHEDHVRRHYTGTLHAYAIEIETQQVWDFAGDGFVHRLIHNKADGKLVEISDPGQTSEERPQTPARLSDIQEERLVHGKLEGLAYQYNTLLTSQLDEQRHFYQKQLNGILEQQEKNRRERKARMVSGSDLISALRQQRRELESKCTSASTRLKKIREETGFLRELNRSLEANKPQLSANLEQAQRDLDSARKAREEWVPKLEGKVAALMLKLDAGVAAAAALSGTASAAAAMSTASTTTATATVGEGDAFTGGCGGQDVESSESNARARPPASAAAAAAASPSVCSSGSAASGVGVSEKISSGEGQGQGQGQGAESTQEGHGKRSGGADHTDETTGMNLRVEEVRGDRAVGTPVTGGSAAGIGVEARGELAGRGVDDDRGAVACADRRGSSSLSGHGGGGTNSTSGKKKGRRRKSK